MSLAPEIQQLEKLIRDFRRDSRNKAVVCANAFWYTQIKPRLQDCVGWTRKFPGSDELEPDLPDGPINFTQLHEAYKPMEDARNKHLESISESDKWIFSPFAYDAAYEYLYDRLPNCKNCDCW